MARQILLSPKFPTLLADEIAQLLPYFWRLRIRFEEISYHKDLQDADANHR